MWLAKNQIAMPTQVQLAHIIDDVIKAKADATPQFQLGEHIIRRYQQRLYLTEKFVDLSQTCIDMPLNQQITLPDNLGTICAAHNAKGILVNWNEKTGSTCRYTRTDSNTICLYWQSETTA